MPKRKIGRQPETPFEDRIDFVRISTQQEDRAKATVAELRKHLRGVEVQVRKWAKRELARKRLKGAVRGFSLPGQARHRAILRKRTAGATRRGVSDVAGELDGTIPRLRIADLSRTRARADALLEEQVNWLETTLKRRWSQAMLGARIDAEQIDYLTRLTFAEFAGWPAPKGP